MQTFESWLNDKFVEENPTVLDDELSDRFNLWLSVLGADDWINYGDDYAKSILPKVEERILDKIM